MIEAARLRYIIEIQDFTMAQDSNGDDVRNYFQVAVVHADIVSKGGRELFAAQQQFAEANAVILIRYLQGIDARMRVYHEAEDTFYDIINVPRGGLGRLEDIMLICKTGIAEEA